MVSIGLLTLIDGFFVDFFLPDLNTIIEVNGPAHYLAPKTELNQTSESRLRVLRSKGYKIITVPFFANDPTFPNAPKVEDILDEL